VQLAPQVSLALKKEQSGTILSAGLALCYRDLWLQSITCQSSLVTELADLLTLV
jgi:hypothetical protein